MSLEIEYDNEITKMLMEREVHRAIRHANLFFKTLPEKIKDANKNNKVRDNNDLNAKTSQSNNEHNVYQRVKAEGDYHTSVKLKDYQRDKVSVPLFNDTENPEAQIRKPEGGKYIFENHTLKKKLQVEKTATQASTSEPNYIEGEGTRPPYYDLLHMEHKYVPLEVSRSFGSAPHVPVDSDPEDHEPEHEYDKLLSSLPHNQNKEQDLENITEEDLAMDMPQYFIEEPFRTYDKDAPSPEPDMSREKCTTSATANTWLDEFHL